MLLLGSDGIGQVKMCKEGKTQDIRELEIELDLPLAEAAGASGGASGAAQGAANIMFNGI